MRDRDETHVLGCTDVLLLMPKPGGMCTKGCRLGRRSSGEERD